MSSTEERHGEPLPAGKDYTDIIKSDLESPPEFSQGHGQPAKIVYYCQECEAISTPKRVQNRFQFKCAKCGSAKVAFGTEKSIASYYRLNGPAGKASPVKGTDRAI
jgi:DNA-directed RNA polymerase subunit RPC12/RpoP